MLGFLDAFTTLLTQTEVSGTAPPRGRARRAGRFVLFRFAFTALPGTPRFYPAYFLFHS